MTQSLVEFTLYFCVTFCYNANINQTWRYGITKDKATKSNVKKPIFKKWWFWVIIVAILAAIFGNSGTNDSVKDETKDAISSTEQQTEEKQDISTSKDDISFVVSNVRNDVTGNWRIATIAENIEMQDYALDYYKEYFKSDDEIHAIVNFNYKTTTKISVMGNLLDVSVYEYVDKEEHDAKLLFSGKLLKEYHVNKDTGEIEEIQ